MMLLENDDFEDLDEELEDLAGFNEDLPILILEICEI